MNYLYVGVGGFIGAVLRVGTGDFLFQLFPNTLFPLPTLTINLIGAFILAYFLANSVKKVSNRFKLFFSTGLLGSFTTFSTFSAETLGLLNSGKFWLAFLYITFSLIGGILFAWLGFKAATIELKGIDIPSVSRREK